MHQQAITSYPTGSQVAFSHMPTPADKKDIDSFEFRDFELEGYAPHKAIKMQASPPARWLPALVWCVLAESLLTREAAGCSPAGGPPCSGPS